VVSGLQRVRPGMEVNPGKDPIPMPIVSAEEEPASAAGGSGRAAKDQNHEVLNKPSGGK
jgi:hypothetical protein